MATVTIEGSIAPCGFLARGDRATVQLTDDVRALINEGYVNVIEVLDDGDDVAPPAPEPETPAEGDKADEPAAKTAAKTAAPK